MYMSRKVSKEKVITWKKLLQLLSGPIGQKMFNLRLKDHFTLNSKIHTFLISDT